MLSEVESNITYSVMQAVCKPPVVVDLMHASKSLVRNLRDPVSVCVLYADRLMKVISRNINMHANRKSDKGIVLKKFSNKGSNAGGGNGGKAFD